VAAVVRPAAVLAEEMNAVDLAPAAVVRVATVAEIAVDLLLIAAAAPIAAAETGAGIAVETAAVPT
jgi:hypothetical protein